MRLKSLKSLPNKSAITNLKFPKLYPTRAKGVKATIGAIGAAVRGSIHSERGSIEHHQMRRKKSASTNDLFLRDEAAQLLARVVNARSLDVDAVLPRIQTTLEKYLLRDRPGASPHEVTKFIAGLHADELVLVIACECGDEAAWHDLMEGYRTTVLSAARGASAGEAEADELAQSVWAELYGLRKRGDGRPAGKLAYYSGCGSLGGWLRAVVGQLGVDRHRRSSRFVQTEEDGDFDRLVNESECAGGNFRVEAAPDPERAFAETEAAQSVHAALSRVLAALPDEDRLLVKLYYLDGLRLREAGAVLGVHEATASRRLARLHTEIRRSVESLLAAEHRWTPEEISRTLTEVSARLDADFSQMLIVEPASAEQQKER